MLLFSYQRRIPTKLIIEPSSCLYDAYNVIKTTSSFNSDYDLVISSTDKAVDKEFVWQNTYGAKLDFQINNCLPKYLICVIII